jgi:hypothetical protein
MKLLVGVLLIAQVASTVGEWVPVATKQIGADEVVKLDSALKPVLATCQEIQFASSGLDVVSESQFSVVIELVVDRTGGVARFRVLRKPELPIEFTKPLQTALAKWRYSAIPAQQRGAAFSFVEVLSKRLGTALTDDCKRLRSRQAPPNQRLQPTASAVSSR